MPTNREERRTPNGAAPGGGNGAAKDAPPSLLGGIQQRVTSRVDEQKNRAADGLGGIASVIQNASNELRNENEALASYVDMASDQMRRFAAHIRERGVADMMDDVAAFARRRPAVFIGGAFLLGVCVARFLKSSADRETIDTTSRAAGFSTVDPMTSQAPSYGTSGYGDAGY
jgi:hypothetical protein